MEIRPVQIIIRLVIEEDGKVLIVRRSEIYSRPGEWEFIGGKLDYGETLEQCAIRELKEEANLELTDKLVYDMSANYVHSQTEEQLVVVFITKIHNSDIVLSDEHDEYKWVDKFDIEQLDLTPDYRAYLIDYFYA